MSSLNPAVKLEAARVILRVSRLSRRGSAAAAAASSSGSHGSSGSNGQVVGRLRLVGEVPPSTAAAAIEVRETAASAAWPGTVAAVWCMTLLTM